MPARYGFGPLSIVAVAGLRRKRPKPFLASVPKENNTETIRRVFRGEGGDNNHADHLANLLKIETVTVVISQSI